jgi:hypothetical protein
MYCFVGKQTILSVGTGAPASNFTIGAAPATPGSFVPTYLTLSDDVTAVRGPHTFAFGYSSFKYQHSQRASATVVGNFAFNAASTGFAITDFLLGRLASLNQSVPAASSPTNGVTNFTPRTPGKYPAVSR